MKYLIRKKRLPFAREDQRFTLTICLGCVQVGSEPYEAKIQFPVSSYREGLYQYRAFLREQRESPESDPLGNDLRLLAI